MLVKAIVPTEQVVDVICDVCGDFLELDLSYCQIWCMGSGGIPV